MIKIIKGSIFAMTMFLWSEVTLAYKQMTIASLNQAPITLESNVSNICMPYLKSIEKKHGIPNQLLIAIAQVESGRWNEKKKKHEPWPWAVHAEGKGHFFASKTEAILAVREMLNRGITNIDVGCMQINIGHHGHAFQTLSHMFDPQHNIAYAGKFLKALQENSSSWSQAIAHYHSATPLHHIPYRKKVYKAWAQAKYENFASSYDDELVDMKEEDNNIDWPQNHFRKVKPCLTRFDPGDEIGATSYQMRSLNSKNCSAALKLEHRPSNQALYGLVGARRLVADNKNDKAKPIRVAYGKRMISRPLMLKKSKG
jgi:hypothetical protein